MSNCYSPQCQPTYYQYSYNAQLTQLIQQRLSKASNQVIQASVTKHSNPQYQAALQSIIPHLSRLQISPQHITNVVYIASHVQYVFVSIPSPHPGVSSVHNSCITCNTGGYLPEIVLL